MDFQQAYAGFQELKQQFDSGQLAEAAARLHCSPATVYKLIAGGTLPAVETAGQTRLDRVAVEAYGKRQRPSRHEPSRARSHKP